MTDQNAQATIEDAGELKNYARALTIVIETRAIAGTGVLHCHFNNQKAEAYLVEQLKTAGFTVGVQAEPETPSLAMRRRWED